MCLRVCTIRFAIVSTSGDDTRCGCAGVVEKRGGGEVREREGEGGRRGRGRERGSEGKRGRGREVKKWRRRVDD